MALGPAAWIPARLLADDDRPHVDRLQKPLLDSEKGDVPAVFTRLFRERQRHFTQPLLGRDRRTGSDPRAAGVEIGAPSSPNQYSELRLERLKRGRVPAIPPQEPKKSFTRLHLASKSLSRVFHARFVHSLMIRAVSPSI